MKNIYVNPSWVPIRTELYKLYDEILSSGELTNNKKYVQLFEKKLVRDEHSAYAYTTSNGTAALQIAIRALEILEGEIITTPHSFIASASSIVWQNCKPIFVDIDPQTLCINPDLIESKITEKTKAILAVHIYGNVCDIEAIEKIGNKYQIPIIYDASHAFGATYKNKSIFTYGTVSTVSLHASKIVSSIEGGVVFCNNERLADRIYKIRYFGKNSNNEEELIGINGKMSEFNAAFGLLSLANLNSEISARTTLANYYNQAFKKLENIQLVKYKNNSTINYAYFPIIFPSETKLLEILNLGKEKNVFFKRIAYPSLNTLPILGSNENSMPVSDSISKRIMCIPIYKGLTRNDQDRIIEIITS